MTKKQQIKIFEEKKVRTVWDDQEERWYFSIADVAHEGGKIAGDARKQLEKRVGHSVISPSKAVDYLPPVTPTEELPESTAP